MDERQAKEPYYKLKWVYNGTLEVYLDMEAHISSATQITQEEPKETTKERGISLALMGQRSIYNSTHKPKRSLNEKIGFNHDDHLHRMCNETGTNSRNSYGRDGDITCMLPAQSYPTRFYQRANFIHMYVSHVIQILKNPPQYTMRYSVQLGRNTKNETRDRLLEHV